MINYNTIGNSLKVGLVNFSKKITRKFNKTKQKFVADMLFGIIAAGSCKLTDIGRTLKETIALKKTTERLGRNLSEFSKSDRQLLTDDYLTAAKIEIGSDTMILVDGSDVTKPCSPKMEAIGYVRDGDTGKFAPGYWTMGAVALSAKNRQPIPVYESLYPCKKQGGLGFNAETAKCLKELRKNFSTEIPRVFDRGFDSKDVVNYLLGNDEKFILRVGQNRVAIHNGKKSYSLNIAQRIVCEHALTYTSKDGIKVQCEIGMTQATIPLYNNAKLNIVVCKGFGEPLVLYTNLAEDIESLAVRIVKMYLMRWRIEEYNAFKKQGLKLEDFRVRSLNSIKNLNLLLTIAAGYIAILSEKPSVSELIEVSKRVQKTGEYLKKAKFMLYAILYSVSTAFASLRCGIARYFEPETRDYQLMIKGVKILG
jgi:hypothetical protein